MARRVCVIGLDCATPQLVFDRFAADLPNLDRLRQNGLWGNLESSIPPITVPAWCSMMTSKDPGRLGFYGFRNRIDHSYDKLAFATSRLVKEDTVWDILSRIGKKVILVGVPQTYPPTRVNGVLVSCFLTPDTSVDYTYPKELKGEIKWVVGDYILDVHDFRTEDKQRILDSIYEMTEKRFRLVRHLLETREWDFAMMVEMGVDRIHHGFWKYTDPSHPKYEPGNPFEHSIRDYYRFVDEEVGKVLNLLDEETAVLVVSDHGAKAMVGGICVNEWLRSEGYLALRAEPTKQKRLEMNDIDWGRTRAWGEGGYYCRLFVNVKGREPQGVVEASEYEAVREEIKTKLEAMTDESGVRLGTRVFKPEEIYPVRNGVPPDLIVYFGNLDWRSVGSVGMGSIYTYENDTGPDDANHAEHGIFIMSGGGNVESRRLEGLHLMDVAPTVLELLDVSVPPDMEGKAVQFQNNEGGRFG